MKKTTKIIDGFKFMKDNHGDYIYFEDLWPMGNMVMIQPNGLYMSLIDGEELSADHEYVIDAINTVYDHLEDNNDEFTDFELDPDFEGLKEEHKPICQDYTPGQYVEAI